MFIRYLAEIIDNIRIFLMIITSIVFFGSILFTLASEAEEIFDRQTNFKILKRGLIISLFLYIIYTLLPNKQSFIVIFNIM